MIGLDPRQLLWRLAVIGLVATIVQIAAVSQLEILGANADVTPLVVAAVGLLAGSLPGAAFGFGIGLLLDLALVQTVGMSSLLLLALGYGAGRLRELRDPQGALVPIAVGAGATALALVGFALMSFLLGGDAPLDPAILWRLALTLAWGTLLAAPVHALVRRVLLPALPEDPRRRRRRAYTTGGLSPLSRA